MKIKKGDTVYIISGKDRGKTGKVIRAIPKENRILVEGISLVKRHQRPRKAREKGQIIEKPLAIHVSNASILDPKTNKPSRIGFSIVQDKKVRVSKKSGGQI